MSDPSANEIPDTKNDDLFGLDSIDDERVMMDANFDSHLNTIKQIQFQEELARLDEDEETYSTFPIYRENFDKGFEFGKRKGIVEGRIEWANKFPDGDHEGEKW